MRKKRNATRDTYKWLGHIQVYFNDDEAKEVVRYIEERQWDCEAILVDNTQSAYPTKITYNATDDCYQITVQPKSKDSYLYGYTVGFTHLDLLRGLCVMAFIIHELIPTNALDLPSKPTVASF